MELEKQGKAGAKAARHAVEQIDAYLAACQLGITIASIGLGALAEPAFEHLLEPLLGSFAPTVATTISFIFAFGLVTLLHVVLGELAPKSLAIARTTPTVLFVAPPMRIFYLVTKPLVDAFNGLGNLVLRPFGIPPAREVGHAPHTEDELRMLLAQSVREGMIETYEREFAENVLVFGDLRARQVMVPRGEIDYLVLGESIGEAVQRASGSLHTRLPLCKAEDGLDDPVGVVNFKELLRLALGGVETDLSELARPLTRVSESTLVDQVLRKLRQRRQHLALVVDEFGTTVGLVTLEDILEEIVGEFEEEEDGEHVARDPSRRRRPGGRRDGATRGRRGRPRHRDRELRGGHHRRTSGRGPRARARGRRGRHHGGTRGHRDGRRRGAHRGVAVAGATGLEPAASGVTGRRSNQLSYAPAKGR